LTRRLGSSAYNELQYEFEAAVDDPRVIRVRWTTRIERWLKTGSQSNCSAQILNYCSIIIDNEQAKGPYGIDTPTGCRLVGPWSLGALIADEFGHVFTFLNGGSVQEQSSAIQYENVLNAAFPRRPARSFTCPP